MCEYLELEEACLRDDLLANDIFKQVGVGWVGGGGSNGEKLKPAPAASWGREAGCVV